MKNIIEFLHPSEDGAFLVSGLEADYFPAFFVLFQFAKEFSILYTEEVANVGSTEDSCLERTTCDYVVLSEHLSCAEKRYFEHFNVSRRLVVDYLLHLLLFIVLWVWFGPFFVRADEFRHVNVIFLPFLLESFGNLEFTRFNNVNHV